MAINFKEVVRLFHVVIVLAVSTSVSAWQLDTSKSSISFISIKNTNVGEQHNFTDFSGSIHNDLAAIVIKADSVDGKIPIRNERMREFLFETDIYPTIKVYSNVKEVLESLKSNTSNVIRLAATLAIHGVERKIDLEARVSAIGDSLLAVSSTSPILIRAENYSMAKGLAKLSSLVNNIAISGSVPVSFSLVFKK